MFQVNEKVVHPKFGACKITKTGEKLVLGKTERCLFLTPLFDNPTRLTITLPLRSVNKVGLRRPLDGGTIQRIKKLLLSRPDQETLKNQTSTPFIKEKIHSGKAIKIAEALRDLFFKNRIENGKYSNVNRRAMFRKAFQMLSAEIAISQEMTVDEAGTWITTVLKKHERFFEAEAASL
jgi:CarD family transcriptional regulator